MENEFYYENDVCIVGMGCVLPDADNPREFWDNILKGHCSIREMPDNRLERATYVSKNKKDEDKTYSNYAAFVDDERLGKIAKKLELDFSKNNRLEIMTFEAVRQALDCFNANIFKKAQKNTAVFLGSMGINEDLISEKFFLHNKAPLKKYIKKSGLKDGKRIFKALKTYFNGKKRMEEKAAVASIVNTSILYLIKKRIDINGEGLLGDAACASSFVAIDAAVNALQNYTTDLALAGGIESSLGADTFVSFSKVGALSAERCAPFDKKADGLSQGEGVVIFALRRIDDAIRDKNKIYGVIRSIGGASDGRSSSLFSPSLDGQVLAYQRAYEGLDKKKIDYIECHGTGTKIGDTMEIKSLNSFFHNVKIPVGSIKSLIGHTKSTAGAAGLLKCLLIIENKTIPPSKYISSPITPQNGAAMVNKKAIILPKRGRSLRLGASSFGFGNINYHLIIDEFESSRLIQKTKKNENEDSNTIVIIGSASSHGISADAETIAKKFKIPPQSIPCTDRIQLLALDTADKAFKKARIKIDDLEKEKVSVISATSLGLDFAVNFTERIMVMKFRNALEFLNEKDLETMINYRDRFPEVTEDTGPGVLNNVIAGRICNVFDFKGKNFNVDSDLNSFPAALNIAMKELIKNEGIILLISCDEKPDKKRVRIKRKSVSCTILSTLAFAKKKNLPIRKVIETTRYYE